MYVLVRMLLLSMFSAVCSPDYIDKECMFLSFFLSLLFLSADMLLFAASRVTHDIMFCSACFRCIGR